MSSPYNQRILAVLRRLAILRELQGDTWEAYADQKAITAISGLNHELKSGVDAAHVLNVGRGISKHIDEILSNTDPAKTGIPDLDNAPKEVQDKVNAIANLMSVGGIGFGHARAYYSQGIKTPEQLLAYGEEVKGIPGKRLTSRESVGAEFAGELSTQIPRSIVTRFGKALQMILDAVNQAQGTHLEYHFSGMYRRDLSMVSDIDVVLYTTVPGEVRKDWPLVLDALEHMGYVRAVKADGPERFEGIANLGPNYEAVRINIYKVDDIAELPYVMLYTTGSQQYNILMRWDAKGLGYHLTNRYMLNPAGQRVPATSEKDIYAALNLPYTDPTMRSL